jgi:hypothetical protein
MEPRHARAKSLGSKERKFYELLYPLVEYSSGRKFLNEEEVCSGSGSPILSVPSRFQRGFRNYAIRPRFRISKRLGRKPYDVELYTDYWLVSDRAKQLFDRISTTDFTYLAVDTEFDSGCEPTTYWLCDIVTVLDALDESRSVVESWILRDGSKMHHTRSSLAFDEKLVGPHSIFRMKTSTPTLICDERFKAGFKQCQLTGLRFRDPFEPPFDKVGTVTALPQAHPPRFGTIKPEGRGKEVLFQEKALDGLDGLLDVGETVRVIGRRSVYGCYIATRLERCRLS